MNLFRESFNLRFGHDSGNCGYAGASESRFQKLHLAFHDVDRQSSERSLLVPCLHIASSLIHRPCDLIQRDLVIPFFIHRQAGSVDSLHRSKGIPFNAGNLHETGDGITGHTQVIFHRNFGGVLHLFVRPAQRGDQASGSHGTRMCPKQWLSTRACIHCSLGSAIRYPNGFDCQSSDQELCSGAALRYDFLCKVSSCGWPDLLQGGSESLLPGRELCSPATSAMDSFEQSNGRILASQGHHVHLIPAQVKAFPKQRARHSRKSKVPGNEAGSDRRNV